MANRWSVWRAELERISPFSADWNEGEPEDFIRVLEEIAARKRAERDAAEGLAKAIQNLRSTCARALAFFEFERACQTWSAGNCDKAALDGTLQALSEWQGLLLRYNGLFPPPRERIQTYAALHECAMEAAAAMATLRPGFRKLSALLSPRINLVAMPARERKCAVALLPE